MIKKFKISTIFTIALAMLVVGVSSCAREKNSYYDAKQSEFVVVAVLERPGMSKMTTYRVLMLDESGIGEIDFWVVDSIGKYKLGDKLLLQPLSHQKMREIKKNRYDR